MQIVIPFSRKHLQKELINIYKPLGVTLYPIQHENIEWGEDWIKPVFYSMEDRKPFDPCYDKLNFFKFESSKKFLFLS